MTQALLAWNRGEPFPGPPTFLPTAPPVLWVSVFPIAEWSHNSKGSREMSREHRVDPHSGDSLGAREREGHFQGRFRAQRLPTPAPLHLPTSQGLCLLLAHPVPASTSFRQLFPGNAASLLHTHTHSRGGLGYVLRSQVSPRSYHILTSLRKREQAPIPRKETRRPASASFSHTVSTAAESAGSCCYQLVSPRPGCREWEPRSPGPTSSNRLPRLPVCLLNRVWQTHFLAPFQTRFL
jgi:hypothetical protein